MQVRVAPVDASSGRRLAATDALGLTVTTPSGAKLRLPLRLEADGSAAEWAVVWGEAGTHSLRVAVAGQPVRGSPFSVAVRAQPLSLAHSAMSGAGLTRAVAGERAVVCQIFPLRFKFQSNLVWDSIKSISILLLSILGVHRGARPRRQQRHARGR